VQWEYNSYIDSFVGLAGHSYGALATAQLAADFGSNSYFRAFASLGGQFGQYLQHSNAVLSKVSIPKLFAFGTGEDPVEVNATGGDGLPYLWKVVAPPKHSLELVSVGHGGYLPPGAHCSDQWRGACTPAWRLVGDILITFFARYLPPTKLPKGISASLDPPTLKSMLALNPPYEQQFFFGGYLQGKDAFSGSPYCKAVLRWQTSSGAPQGHLVL
jgi:hypothetical protein